MSVLDTAYGAAWHDQIEPSSAVAIMRHEAQRSASDFMPGPVTKLPKNGRTEDTALEYGPLAGPSKVYEGDWCQACHNDMWMHA